VVLDVEAVLGLGHQSGYDVKERVQAALCQARLVGPLGRLVGCAGAHICPYAGFASLAAQARALLARVRADRRP
jgi:hypothetical protein